MSAQDILSLVIEASTDLKRERPDVIFALIVILTDLQTGDILSLDDDIKKLANTREIPRSFVDGYISKQMHNIEKLYPKLLTRLEKTLEDEDDGDERYDAITSILETVKTVPTEELKTFLNGIATEMYVTSSALVLTPARLVALANLLTLDLYNFWHSILFVFTRKNAIDKELPSRIKIAMNYLQELKSPKFKAYVRDANEYFPTSDIDLRTALAYQPTRSAIFSMYHWAIPQSNNPSKLYMQFTPNGPRFDPFVSTRDGEIGAELGFDQQDLINVSY